MKLTFNREICKNQATLLFRDSLQTYFYFLPYGEYVAFENLYWWNAVQFFARRC